MRLAIAMGGKAETLMGLAGMGDLVLTCTDNQSRNRRMGLLLAQSKSVDQAIAEIRQVVEGVKAAPEGLRLAQRSGVDMPITEAVHGLLHGQLSAVKTVHIVATPTARARNTRYPPPNTD